ncbi:hypothetical protein MTR_0014s0390 [Medicago truncatula]|uniref:Uncharacterized protein n=1 Tax=Medicago truncatula TaxID=3880 RepID=A0A072TJ52_MEDTR|nr:hypothetical protein MTR_0014s0390 [Medicago truncatula]
MTVEACQWKNTLCQFTNGDFFQTFGQQWALSPRDISCYLVLGFTPSTVQFVHSNIIFKEVCRVFVLRYQSASHLTYLVSFHRVYLSYTVIQLHFHIFTHSHIHTSIHSYNHAFINIFTYSYVHAYTAYPQHHPYMAASVRP